VTYNVLHRMNMNWRGYSQYKK